MPRSIKWFIWLSIAFVLWSSFWNFQAVLWPTAHYVKLHAELLAKTPPEYRDAFERAELVAALTRTALWVLPFIVFAVSASVFRQGWARWAVVIVLAAKETFWPFLYAGYAYLFQPDIFKVVMQREVPNWLQNGYRFNAAHWAHWVTISMMALLVALIFWPTSKPWFRKSP